MTKTRINEAIVDWTRVKNHCRTTNNKEFSNYSATNKFKRELLISEHTPIRLIEFDWTWENIPYWVSTEWARHKFEKFISTQRDDRTANDIPRAEKPQGALVNFDGYANEQNLIDAFRKRLCFAATKEARELAESFKLELLTGLYKLEGSVLVPNCVYRCGCPEAETCGFWKKFKTWVFQNFDGENILYDIQLRYEVYNLYFLKTHMVTHEDKQNSEEAR